MAKRALEEEEAEGMAKRASTEETGSDVEEFFALLERIEATEKQFGILRRVNTSKPLHRPTDKEAATSKPAWRPSFVWEDFCETGNGNGTRDVHPSSASKAEKGYSKEGNPLPIDNDNNKNNCVKLQCVFPDQKNTDSEGIAERLDLNLPLTSAELELFY